MGLRWPRSLLFRRSALVTYWPAHLQCRACGLELGGDDALAAAGVQRSWQIEDAAASDFYEDSEER